MQNSVISRHLSRSEYFSRSAEHMDKHQQYKTMIVNVALTSWIEAIAISEEFHLEFSSQYHRRFLADILGLYRVNDREQIEGLHESLYLIDVFKVVHEFQSVAYSQSGASQKLLDGRCDLVDAVIDDLRVELQRFHIENFGREPSGAEAVARVIRLRGLKEFFVSGINISRFTE